MLYLISGNLNTQALHNMKILLTPLCHFSSSISSKVTNYKINKRKKKRIFSQPLHTFNLSQIASNKFDL